MDAVPLWLQMISAIGIDLGSLATIVGYLWPVFVGKETLPELLRRRFSGGQAPPPKRQRRAIFNILALVVPLLIIVASSAFIGSRLLPHGGGLIITGTPTSSLPSVLITAPTDESQVSILTPVQGTAMNIPKDEELWLFIAPFNQTTYFPQHGPIKILDEKWSTAASFGGANDVGLKFRLIPVLINQNDIEAHDAIAKYFQQPGPVYKGIAPTSGMQLMLPGITVVRV